MFGGHLESDHEINFVVIFIPTVKALELREL